MSTKPDDDSLAFVLVRIACWFALALSVAYLFFVSGYPTGDSLVYQFALTRAAMLACASLVAVAIVSARR